MSVVAARRLEPGYYLIRVSGCFRPETDSLVVDSAGGVANAATILSLRFGRLFMLRVAKPSLLSRSGPAAQLEHVPIQFDRTMLHRSLFGRIFATPSDSTSDSTWLENAPGAASLQALRLPGFLAPMVKLFRRSRLKARIPLLSGGYAVVLSKDKLPADYDELREFQQIQSRLAPFGLHDANIPEVQSLDSGDGWLAVPRDRWRPLRGDGRKRIAVVLHLYYTDLWPEISVFLAQFRRPFDLIVTHCGLDGGRIEQIKTVFPQAQFRQVENRGRDVWPFIALLNEGALGEYSCICKIHAKKSAHVDGRGETLLGLRWRRRTMCDLLGGGRAETIPQMFEDNPKLGLVGPESLRLPNGAVPPEAAWGSKATREKVYALARKMGVGRKAVALDFFAGSMFWVTPQALEPLRRLNLGRHDFPDEKRQLDGELQHALERVFPLAARLSGFEVADAPPQDIRSLGRSAAPLNVSV